MDSKDCGNESRRTCSPDVTFCGRSHLLPLLLLFILLFVLYFNSFSGTWVFDDHHNITDNHYVHLESLDWKSIKGTFYGVKGDISRPLAYLSFGINHFFHGLDEFGYHLVNFIIHCLSALFLYLFVFRVLHLPIMKGRFDGRAGSIALLASVLWATAPIQVTAVTIIVQRMASMVAMFFIMSMFCYLMGRTAPGLYRKVGWFVLCAISGAAALATKENAVMLPVVLYMLDLILIQGATRENLKRHMVWAGIPLLFLVVMAFILTNPMAYLSGTAYDHREFTLWERLMTQPRILLFYLSLMLYPMTERFMLVHEIEISRSLLSPWTTMPAILFWAAWTALGAFLARRQPLIAFCLLFFVVNHVTESTFIALELIYEHRNYLPSMMLFLLAAWAIFTFLRDFSEKALLKGLTCAFIVITIAGQGYSVIQYNKLFEHPLYLWHYNAEKAPGMSRVHINLGRAYDELGQQELAKESYLKALEADRYHRMDLRAVPLNNIANHYLRVGDVEKAHALYSEALEIDPASWDARLGMGTVLMMAGEFDDAMHVLAATPCWASLFSRTRGLLSVVYLKKGDYDKAINEARYVLSMDERAGFAYKTLGEALRRNGRYDESQKVWQKYAHLNRTDMEALIALLYLSHQADDRGELKSVTGRILTLKGERSWEEVFSSIERKHAVKGFRVVSIDPDDALRMLLRGLMLLKEDAEVQVKNINVE